MGEPAPKPYITHAESLALEEQSPTKHEWLDGVSHDMSGSTPDHAGLAAAIVGEPGNQLRGKRCRVHTADLKVRVLATGLSTYADVSVICGGLEVDPDDRNAATNPVVLVEVLSDSSEAYDRGQKFGHYRRIPSLAEEASAGEVAPLLSIGCALSVDEMYADPLREIA